MGNAPTKLDSSDDEFQVGYSNTQTVGPRRRSTHSSLVTNLLNTSDGRRRSKSFLHNHSSANGNNSINGNGKVRLTTKEKEHFKEQHAMNLINKYEETVDGGFLAPYGCYNFDKLDYDSDIVRNLIIERKLAPFYIPLEDFDETWSDDEVIKIIDGLSLHATYNAKPEEFEDIPIGSLKKSNFDYLIDLTLSKKEQRRMHSKIFRARLYQKRLLWQEAANEKFLEAKIELKKNRAQNKYLPNNDLKLNIYKNGMECPICFLYYPNPLNYSKCCQQPICTECFVQIKRSEPHFPHDEVDPTNGPQDDSEKDPNLLISEVANCPYCATPDFHITYVRSPERKTGIGGIAPYLFQPIQLTKKRSKSAINNKNNKNTNDVKNIVKNSDKSICADTSDNKSIVTNSEHSSISTIPIDKFKEATKKSFISSDDIRPMWEIKLNKERARLAKRSANATAIHVSNQLIDLEFSQRQNDNLEGNSIDNSNINCSNKANSENNTANFKNNDSINNDKSKKKKKKKKSKTIEELEDKMIQEAIRLSLQEQ